MEFLPLLLFGAIVWLLIRVVASNSGRKKLPPKVRRVYPPAKRQTDAQSRFVDMSDPKNQIKAVSEVNFEKTTVLNKSEFRLYETVEKLAKLHGDGHRVMAQVALRELIKPKSDSQKKWALANASINSKRVDIAVIDKFGLPTAVLEYHGSGHHHKDSFIRDAVKKEALRRANVPLLEIRKGDTVGVLKEKLLPLINPNNGKETQDRI